MTERPHVSSLRAGRGPVSLPDRAAPNNRTLAACIALTRAERDLERAKRAADPEMIEAATQRLLRAEVAVHKERRT
jgi:hypothetical protein